MWNLNYNPMRVENLKLRLCTTFIANCTMYICTIFECLNVDFDNFKTNCFHIFIILSVKVFFFTATFDQCFENF